MRSDNGDAALVVTAADMITSISDGGRRASFDAFCRGVSGAKALAYFDHRPFHTRCAYEIPNDRETAFRTSALLARVVAGARDEAGLTAATLDGRVTAIVGTGLRELRSLELWHMDHSPLAIEQLHFGSTIEHALNFDGLTLTLCNACAASNCALGLAEDLLRLGDADVVLVAGCDTLTESMYGLLDRVNPLALTELRPFERERKGVLMGDGAAAVILESADHARARGQRVLAVLRGVGMSCDAFNPTAPDRSGIVAAIRDAHDRAGILPSQVDLLVAHGTGTQLNDAVEAAAIHEAFGSDAGRIPITGLKSMIGHTSGASGLVGVVTAIEAMSHSAVPPTLYFNRGVDEAEGLDIVSAAPRHASIRFAQVNAFGFGGVNAVAILENPRPASH